MSSTYSGDHSNAISARASTKSIGQAIQRTREWMVTYQSTSSHASSRSSSSPRSSKQDELDLDSLFKRLDKYTAEMQEIEERLKRARTVSDKSDRISTKRLSFDSHHARDEISEMKGSTSSVDNTSRLQNTRVRQQGDLASQDVFDDWKTWVDEQFGHAKPPSGRNSSKHSSYRSEQGSLSLNSTWLRLSPTPPVQESPRKLSSTKADSLDQHEEQRQASEQDYDNNDFSDDELDPSVPTSWSPPPRTSSKQLTGDDPSSPETKPAPTKPATRRRMTTTEGRPSIRNGGFWSDQSAGLLPRDDIPAVPVLSQSNSNATLKSSPPLTPLTMGDPREDQVRRELETMSIHAGAEALGSRYKNRRPPMLNLLASDDEEDDLEPVPKSAGLPQSTLLDVNDDQSGRPRSRRRKSVFSIFQRRSPVEKLIDMYLDDEPEERPVSRRASTWSRTVSSGQDKIPKSPSIPPVPQTLHAKQTSL